MSLSLNRRQFVRAGLSTVAATSVGHLANGVEPQPFQLAVKYHMVTERLPLADKLSLLRDLGYQGVEPRFAEVHDLDAWLRAQEESGIRVHGIVNAANFETLFAAIDLAQRLHASSVLIVAGRVNEANAYDAVYRETQARLRDALPRAEEQGIRLLVENVWNNFLLSPMEMARYLDQLHSPAVGAYFDVGNVVRYGWPAQWIDILGPRVVKLDIKEYSRTKQKEEGLWKGFQVELGDGDCDWPAVCDSLAAIGFSGWATAEVLGGDRKRLADVNRRMRNVLAMS